MIIQITDKEIAQAATIEQLRQEVTAWATTVTNLEAELERERIRLAACGVVAMADTPDSAIEARKMHPDYESASCDDVKRRVDECMALRAERNALKSRIETDMKSWYKLHYLMKKHGWPPGRTDDDLIDVLETKLDTLAADAARYRWLTADLDAVHGRVRRNQILARIPAMSYASACMTIDTAMKEANHAI